MTQPNSTARVAHPAVTDAYEKGFQDGVTETLAQLRMRFNLSVIDGLQDFVNEVQEKVDADK